MCPGDFNSQDAVKWPTPVPIPGVDLGGNGPEMVFLHANAYPPECYRPLLCQFAQDFHVRAMQLRPLWQDSSEAAALRSWHTLSSDLVVWMDQYAREPIVAVGHSLGAIVALRAALQEPARFRALVLLDPVLVTRRQILTWRLARHLPFRHRLDSAVRRAEKRRSVFSDVDEAFDAYRPHPIFRKLSDEHLKEVIHGLLEYRDGQLRLRYSPAWEARIYATAVWNDLDLWNGLPALGVPTLIIRGAESDTLTESACGAAGRANHSVELGTVGGATHLVPLERPPEVHAMARQFIERSLRLTHSAPEIAEIPCKLSPA